MSILIIGVLLAAACGGGDDNADEADGSTTTSAAASSEPDETEPGADVEADDSEAGDDIDPDVVAAELAGATLTAGELSAFADAIVTGDPDALSTWLLATAIEQELSAQGRPLTDADLAESEEFLVATAPDPSAALIRANAVFTVARTFGEAQVAPDLAGQEPPEVLCSSHILLETEAEAADVAALAQGGDDFAELAMTYSTGPSGPTGGDLGCTTTATFVPEFSDGARDNGVGITGPVQSQFGWHVIQVRSIGPGTIDIHPELTAEQVTAFEQDAINALLGPYLDELVGAASALVAAEAEIDPSYGTWDTELATLVG